MNFLELQNEVLADRFDPSKRAQVKNWINYRYGRIWVMEPWAFKYQYDDLAVPSGSTSIAIPDDVGKIISFADHSVTPNFYDMSGTRPEDFFRNATDTPGVPGSWTVIGGNIVFPAPTTYDMSFRLVSELKFSELVADVNVPLIPVEFHMAIASGAAAHGLRLENDPSWQGFEDDYQHAIEDMKHEYLTAVSTYGDVVPGWP